jgi:endonuclease-8
MPEGDTVWLTARRLHRALAGRVLAHADLRVPQHATADLRGQIVDEVASRGKHLLTRTSVGLTLHTHLGMEGTWRILRAGRGIPGPGDHRVRVVLGNAEWTAVGSLLPVVELLPTAREETVVGHLGPDLLGADWDADEAVRRLLEAPDEAIGDALLDQRNLAGIGNLYKAELLFLRGVHPWTPVGDVRDLDRMVRLARQLLWTNREHPEQSTTGDLRRGRSHWVYGRGGEACRRCGTLIARGEQGPAGRQRVTYWCPSCQPERRDRR